MKIAWALLLFGILVLVVGAAIRHRETVVTGVILSVTGYTWVLRLKERTK